MARAGLSCAVACISTVLVAGSALRATAQTPVPAPPPVQGPSVALPAGATGDAGCNSVEKPLSAGGASIVPETTGQQKNWQPPGGEIEFTIRSFVGIPQDALVLVCFRWLRADDRKVDYISSRPRHLDFTDGGRLLRVTVTVPQALRNPPGRFSGEGQYAGFSLVPLAEVRIMAFAKDAASNYTVAADVSQSIGVTNPFWALALALAAVLIAFVGLSIICRQRLARDGVAIDRVLIRIITTPDGYASLSQAQIVLWTFVVAASAVYVMALSGELIQVTTGTLVLLGISGSVSVVSRWQDALRQPADPAATPRQPLWSDLVVYEANGQRQIDVTRVQMLYFTLITASFVVLKVLTSYVIPEIPEGFQILMGISNAVYVGSKVAPQPAPAPSHPPVPAPDGATTPPTPVS